MIDLKKAMDAVFGKDGMDYKDAGDQKLIGAITIFNRVKESPKELGALVMLRRCVDDLTQFQKESKTSQLDQKIARLKRYYDREVKVLSAASSKGRRLHVPTDREIHFCGQQ